MNVEARKEKQGVQETLTILYNVSVVNVGTKSFLQGQNISMVVDGFFLCIKNLSVKIQVRVPSTDANATIKVLLFIILMYSTFPNDVECRRQLKAKH
jgi:hypothetical protein